MKKSVPREIADSIALSVKEACETSGIGRTSFYKLLKSGKIPAHKCGRRTLVLPGELEQALQSLPRAGGRRHEHEEEDSQEQGLAEADEHGADHQAQARDPVRGP
jgi:excisionase family DNA binding protein